MFSRTVQLFSLACFSFIVGCGQPQPTGDNPAANNPTGEPDTEHADPHDVPLTDAEIDKLREDTASWTAAVEHIQQYRDTIKTETTSGAPEKAHRALDLLDYVLQWLPEIAQNSNVSKDNWQAIGENAQQLRDAFHSVHANIDDGKAPGYETVSAEIDNAVKALAAIKAVEARDTKPPE